MFLDLFDLFIEQVRKNAGLNELKIIPVELVDEPSPNPIEEKNQQQYWTNTIIGHIIASG